MPESSDEIDQLLHLLSSTDKAIQRGGADRCETLARAGVDMRPQLVEALSSQDSRLRWGAAFALAKLEGRLMEILDVLLENLGSADSDIRWAASMLLRKLEDRSEVIVRLTGLLRSANTTQRRMAAYALRDLHAATPEVEAAVCENLVDPDRTVRMAAMACFVKVATSPEVLFEQLSRRLLDTELTVQRSAAAYLADLASRFEPAADKLRGLVDSDDPTLRQIARRCLSRIAPQ